MKYTREVVEEAVAGSTSFVGVLRYFGLKPSGGSYTHIRGLIDRYEIDTSHFTGQGWSRGRKFPPRQPPEYYLRIWPARPYRIRGPVLTRALLAIGREHVCEGCGNDGTWLGVAISLHVDHINGDRNDCRPQNLRFLCPNCHAQTSTHSSRRRRDAS